jgi:sialate O-acetylesterase
MSVLRPRLRSIALVLLAGSTACAEVRLPAIYGSNMVMQRGLPFRIRGWADPGEQVTLTQGGTLVRAVADHAGRWSAELPAPGTGPLPELVVEGKNRLVLTNLLGGEVWLCSGQSNMEFRLARAEGGAEAAAAATLPSIRLFTVGRRVAAAPLEELEGQWVECTPETAAAFSAVGFFFGAELQRRLDGLPVGLIHSSWGGTPAEAWVDSALTRPDPAYAALYEEWERYRENYPAIRAKYEADMTRWRERVAQAEAVGAKPPSRPLSKPEPDANHQYPGNLYNGMIHPLVGFPLKGVAWYHGTSNTKRAEQYHALLTTLVTDWRRRWGRDEFSFLIVSLANFRAVPPEPPAESAWALLREAQARVAREQPGAGLAVTIDIGEAHDIHPRNKLDVGLRLAASALRVAYGQELVASGPEFAAAERRDGAFRVRFTNVGGGLMAGRDGRADQLTGFALAGADGRWRWAEAKIEGDEVVVRHPDIPSPERLRYGWADNPACNLYNREGFPAPPFRGDAD